MGHKDSDIHPQVPPGIKWRKREPMTSEQVAILDENAEYLGVSTLCLMENAGKEIAKFVSWKLDNHIEGKRIVVFAGTGNNGGDGFVAARHLADMNALVDVLVLGSPEDIRTTIARTNYRAIEGMALSIKKHIIKSASDLENFKKSTELADAVVDAIIGTGVKGKIREPAATAIDLINRSKALKIAVDVPSGVDPDTGEAADVAVRADATVTFHRVKKGLSSCPTYTGEIVVRGIGIPVEAEIIVGPGDVRFQVKPRMRHFHKGDYGRILVVGGSDQYSGAPSFSALASLRTGAGLAIVAAPASVSNVIRGFSPMLIVRDLPGKVLSVEALPIIEELLGWASSAVIGPGLGFGESTKKGFTEALKSICEKNIPTVIDADGLKLLVDNKTIIKDKKVILTPHLGEFKLLTGYDMSGVDQLDEALGVTMREASRLGVTLLVKVANGFATVSNGEEAKANFTGNTGMAKGGVGDVLSGIAGTFLSWAQSPFKAAMAAAFVCGKAGDIAYSKLRDSLTPKDMIESIPDVMKEFYTRNRKEL